MKAVRIGAGAGYSGDRIEPAVELIEHGDLGYIAFECLAERSIALAQLAKLTDPEGGYDPLLPARMQAALHACARRGVRLITNMGAANPHAAGRATAAIARSLRLAGKTIAVVTGDDVTALVRANSFALSTGVTTADLGDRLVSANAYLGAAPLVEALQRGADVIVTGRVADPSLFIAPLIHEHGTAWDDWSTLGRFTAIGHLLECAGQVTGGYFADPGYKDVKDLARLGFPIAEVTPDGNGVITKVIGSGGQVTLATCKEQLLYELHDPAAYLTPDVVADFSRITFRDAGPDRVQVSGGSGHPRPDTLKVVVGYRDGFIGEGQISYAGPGAVERGRLALAIVRERLELIGLRATDLRFDLIGSDSILGPAREPGAPREVRLRVAGRTADRAGALLIGNEVEALYTNGPASGGGATKSVREVVAIGATLIPRSAVTPSVTYLEV